MSLLAPLILVFALAGGGRSAFAASPASQTGFDPHRDGFAFANDTAREYLPDASGQIVSRKRKQKPEFAHSCFLLSRGVMQFSKFARFAPEEPKVSLEEYRWRVMRLFRIPVWYSENREKVEIPGYRNLYEFSAVRENRALLEDTLGNWLMTYFRVGNWRMTFPFPRDGQALAARRLMLGLDRGDLQAVYLASFPRMNHCVVLYGYKPLAHGDVEFHCYDPNYPGQPAWLRYHAGTRSFELEKRWYFNAGKVHVMRVYISPFH